MDKWIKEHKNLDREDLKLTLMKLGFVNGLLLDVGCNAGYYSFAAMELGNLVVGIDSDETAIKEAEKTKSLLISQHKIGIGFKQKNIFEYNPDNRFDYIFCNNTIQYLATKDNKPFKKFSEMIKDNGLLFVGCVPDIGIRYTTKSKKKISRIITKPHITVVAANYGFIPIALYFQFDTHEITYKDKKYKGLSVLDVSLEVGCDVLYSVLFKKVKE